MFSVTGGDSPPAFELQESVFNPVAHPVKTLVIATGNFAVGLGGECPLHSALKRLTGVSITLAARNVSVATLEAALGGTATKEASGSVLAETHKAGAQGSYVSLNSLQDLGQPLTVENGGIQMSEGADYTRRRGGIMTLPGGSIDEDDALSFSYTRLSGQRIQALLYTALDRKMEFDGVNERTGKPWKANFFNVSWSPVDNFDLINEDFANFTIRGEALRDEARTGAGESQFYEVLVGDL